MQEELNQTVETPNKELSSPKKKKMKLRHFLVVMSFIVMFIIPFSLVVIYYAYNATDSYVSKVGFSVRSMQSNSSFDQIGAIVGMPSNGSTTSDSYIIIDYLKSRTFLEEIDKSLNLREFYSDDKIDYISRLSKDASIEDFVEYWRKRIHVSYNQTSSIIEVEVQSFDKLHAKKIADYVLKASQQLINKISSNARRDALKLAREEVLLQENRLKECLKSISAFRSKHTVIDPSAVAVKDLERVANLEQELSIVKTKIARLSSELDDNSPTLLSLQRKAKSLQDEILNIKKITSNTHQESTAKTLEEFESLTIDKNFAQQSYSSSLVSLEKARHLADGQQRYLAVHIYPKVAESAKYPRRIINICIAAFLLLSFWGIVSLFGYSVRDHMT